MFGRIYWKLLHTIDIPQQLREMETLTRDDATILGVDLGFDKMVDPKDI